MFDRTQSSPKTDWLSEGSPDIGPTRSETKFIGLWMRMCKRGCALLEWISKVHIRMSTVFLGDRIVVVSVVKMRLIGHVHLRTAFRIFEQHFGARPAPPMLAFCLRPNKYKMSVNRQNVRSIDRETANPVHN